MPKTSEKKLLARRAYYERNKETLREEWNAARRGYYQVNKEKERAKALARHYLFKKEDPETAKTILEVAGITAPASWNLPVEV